MKRERQSAGVMMIPVLQAGILMEIRGLDEGKAIPDIEEITITSHISQQVLPLPEGPIYLGFIFSRAALPNELRLRSAKRTGALNLSLAQIKSSGHSFQTALFRSQQTKVCTLNFKRSKCSISLFPLPEP